jgi:putative membrane protein
MKVQITALTIVALLFSCMSSTKRDSVVEAKKMNEQKITKGLVDKNISDFLIKATDARLMNIKEGKAAQKSKNTEIRKYGEWRTQDHSIMLKNLKMLANELNIAIPSVISLEKTDGLRDLLAKRGIEFDKEFAKMMVIDHKRDIDEFKKASGFDNKAVNAFATKYLPVIEKHLEGIKAIKELL